MVFFVGIDLAINKDCSKIIRYFDICIQSAEIELFIILTYTLPLFPTKNQDITHLRITLQQFLNDPI